MITKNGTTNPDEDQPPAADSALPSELTERAQWVTWRYVVRDSKPTKPPFNPCSGQPGSVTEPTTWTTYGEAVVARDRYDGLGFVLTAGDPFVGVDLDHCRDARTGALEPWAQDIVNAIASYTEITPSGTGLRIFARGHLPPGGRKHGPVEMYDRDRYLTVTGQHLEGMPTTVEDRTAEILALHARVFPQARTNGPKSQDHTGGAGDDDALLDRAKRAKNGAQFVALWAGLTDGYFSRSEADLALCGMLAFWTKSDLARMDRLFRRSGLIRPKWDERHAANNSTYGEMTIAKAIANCAEGYRPMTSTARSPFIAFEEIMRQPIPPLDWLVEPLIAVGDRVMIFGEIATMKSWIGLDLAVAAASGRHWIGTFAVTSAKSVLYIDEEMNERTLRRRIRRLGDGAGLGGTPLPIRCLSRAGIRFDGSGAKALLKRCTENGFDPDVIIVDTLRRVLVGSENEAKDVAEFWRNVEPLLRAGKTLIIIHHMKKPSGEFVQDSRHRASGSTDILAGADAAFAIVRLGTRGDTVRVECVKSRDGDPEDFMVRLEDDGTPDAPVRMRYGGTAAEYKEDSKKMVSAGKAIIAWLQHTAEPALTKAMLTALAAQGFAHRTVERALHELKKDGTIKLVARGTWALCGIDCRWGVGALDRSFRQPPTAPIEQDGGGIEPPPHIPPPPPPASAMAEYSGPGPCRD